MERCHTEKMSEGYMDMGKRMGKMTEEKLRRLYVGEKRSAKDIADIFGCSEHKVNYWFEKFQIQKRSISEAIYAKRNPDGDPFRVREVKSRADARLFGLGLGLYWGEGNKKSKNSIRLGNTSPAIIRTFIEFLVRMFGIHKSKLRFGLQIFTDIPKEKALAFWFKELKEFNISRRQFFRVTVTPARGVGNYREKSQYGVLTVHFCNSKLKRILDSMLPM